MGLNFPYDKGFEVKLEDKQYAESRVIIRDTGKGTVISKFSNGKKFDGDTFIAVTLFYDANNAVVAGVKQRKGLNAAGLSGGAKTDHVETNFEIPAANLATINSVDVFYGRQDTVNDAKVWNALKTILSALWQSGDSAYKLFNPPVKL